MKPYKIIGAYDSETTNIKVNGVQTAFPILHQLGILDCGISDITPDNVEMKTDVFLFRHTLELHSKLDELCDTVEYTPVLLCHNLSFDMYGLSSWLNEHDVRVLAKSPRKPITFSILGDDGKPCLVIWDTLIFSQQSLYRMGLDCGYSKAKGEWDYNLVRTPETALSDDEIDYAKRDIYALLTWVSWWLHCNPDIDEGKLGLNVVTKTGIVRERRKNRFSQLRNKRYKCNVGKYWFYQCRSEAPKTDDELFTMLACTRGGFTFCASKHASIPYDFTGTDKTVIGYDATSQHPAQIVSRYYPIDFKPVSAKVLDMAFKLVGAITMERILECHDKPFPVAFNACFRFHNIRPRENSLFENEGIFPLASARYRKISDVQIEENGDLPNQVNNMKVNGYVDSGYDVETAFGKIIRAKTLTVWITELTAWEIWQAYEWDEVEAISGYETGRFTRPCDIDAISVMQFYKAKNAFKKAREEYFRYGKITNAIELTSLNISPSVVQEMENGSASETDVNAVYMGLKADLNSIFGISATNSYRRDTVLTENGIEYEGEFGICNAPKNSKVWYQFGQRIVGWSRIAQIIIMQLVYPHVDGIINGDTDSLKVIVKDENRAQVENALSRYADALDCGKEITCMRVKTAYPTMYDALDGIGHYVSEFETDRFCASWNKAYILGNGDEYKMTVAGLPSKPVEEFANGMQVSFDEICNLLLGYNVTYAPDLTGLNARKFPEWGSMVFEKITDYKGNESLVAEPAALSIYPMPKTINDTSNPENAVNLSYALMNNENVNQEPLIICKAGVLKVGEML